MNGKDETIQSLVIQAGEIARNYFLKVSPAWKDNLTYVTDADLAVQDFLRQHIEREYPNDGILAEERGLRKRPAGSDRTWVIDPIDGTASFVAGLPVWGIALGLLEGETPISGYFMMPTTGDFFETAADGKVLRNGVETHINRSPVIHRETCILTISRFHHYHQVAPEYPGKIRSLGSSIAHLVYTAVGSADAVLVGRTYLWDLAAGLAMLYRNGGVLRYLDKTPVSLTPLMEGKSLAAPAIGGHPAILDALEGMFS